MNCFADIPEMPPLPYDTRSQNADVEEESEEEDYTLVIDVSVLALCANQTSLFTSIVLQDERIAKESERRAQGSGSVRK